MPIKFIFAFSIFSLSMYGYQYLSGLPPVSSVWIPWLSLTFSAHFSLTLGHRSHGYHVKSRAKWGKILRLQPLRFYKNMPRNQGQTLGHLGQIIFPDFPWLSTKNIEIPWLSLTFQKVKFFPDFPWWWQPWFIQPWPFKIVNEKCKT